MSYLDDMFVLYLDQRTKHRYLEMVEHFVNFCNSRGFQTFPLVREVVDIYINYLEMTHVNPIRIRSHVRALQWYLQLIVRSQAALY